MSPDRKFPQSVRPASPESRKMGGSAQSGNPGNDSLRAPSTVSTDDVEASETMSYLSMEVGAGSVKVCH
jgi:hypothetical protein